MQDKRQELIEIVGDENVYDDPSVLDEYSKDNSFVNRMRPDYVVKPKNADEVEAIVKWANNTLIPLVPVSSGPPRFRGDTVPSTGGAVIFDLRRMKQVLSVDRRNRVAMIEPGVTFAELIPELKKNGLRANIPFLPRQSKSVIGSMLEREPGIMPKYQWDISDPLACTEVIYGTGDLFRTGSAAGPGTLEEQRTAGAAQKGPAGPGQADFYRLIQGAQGTMGIVTWATLRCELLPSLQEPFVVGSSNLDDLLEFTYWLIRLKLVDECLIQNRCTLATILTMNGNYEPLVQGLPRWLLFFCIAGYEYFPEERVAYQIEQMMDIAKRVALEPGRAIGKVSAYELLRILGKPAAEPYWKLRRKGSCYEIFFLTTRNKLPEIIHIMQDVANKYGYPVEEMGILLQPVVQATSYHCEFDMFYDPNSPTEVDKAQEFFVDASKVLMANGAFFSRPYGLWADMVYRRDGGTATVLRKVKEIFDPKNILNPGKLCF